MVVRSETFLDDSGFQLDGNHYVEVKLGLVSDDWYTHVKTAMNGFFRRNLEPIFVKLTPKAWIS